MTEDPKAYMKQFLEKLKDARTVQRNYPCIFDDSNVRSLFGMLDVTGKGFITYEQYKQGKIQFLTLHSFFSKSLFPLYEAELWVETHLPVHVVLLDKLLYSS